MDTRRFDSKDRRRLACAVVVGGLFQAFLLLTVYAPLIWPVNMI